MRAELSARWHGLHDAHDRRHSNELPGVERLRMQRERQLYMEDEGRWHELLDDTRGLWDRKRNLFGHHVHKSEPRHGIRLYTHLSKEHLRSRQRNMPG